MNTFIGGIAVGFVLFGIMASVVIFNRMQLEIAKLAKDTENMNKALQMMFMKINKIEKITQTTMDAAETFVDAIRSSAEQMMVMRPPTRGNMSPEGFDDLRKSFEEGIRKFEENEMNDSDDEEDSEGEGEEPWKKK
jgi:hypothetical protein